MPLTLVQKKTRREEAEERLAALWSLQPDPHSIQEKERFLRTLQLFGDLKGKQVADLGSGYGIFAKKMRDYGATVHAVDLFQEALNYVKNETGIIPVKDYIPYTTLRDYNYDLVISTDVIAYLPQHEHRLFMNEAARILKREGQFICSTPLDTDSEDAFECFQTLVETEFIIEEQICSYHHLYNQLPFKSRKLMLFLETFTGQMTHVIFKCRKKQLVI